LKQEISIFYTQVRKGEGGVGMKKISGFLLLIQITAFTQVFGSVQQVPCVLLDLAGHEEVVYSPFMGLMRIAGFAPSYSGLATFVDEPGIIDRIASSKGMFLVVAPDLLANFSVSPVGKKLKQLLARVAQQPNFFVGLLLPSFNGVRPDVALVPALRDLFEPLGITADATLLGALERTPSTPINVHKLATAAIDFFLKNPINSRPMPYHTSLAMPHEGRALASRVLRAAHDNPQLSLTMLPAYARRFASPKLLHTLPYFLYNYSSRKQLHVLVGYDMLATGFGITEQFHIRPLKTSLAKEMIDLMGLALAQFHGLVTKAEPVKKNFHAVVKNVTKPDFSEVVESFGKSQSAHPEELRELRLEGDRSAKGLRKVAWMELTMFEPLTPEEAKKKGSADRELRQKKLINYLVTAQFDGLWITFNPHQYWSPIARKKEREEIFLASVRSFTRQLAAASKRAKRPYPALLVGFEITNNVYLPNLPKVCAVDAFGNEFSDIPAALHQPFWQNEVINPLEELAKRWQDPKLSHGIPLRGVVIDLEMYCRKRTGSFTATSGFDKESLGAFDPALGVATVSVHDAMQSLMSSSRYAAYLTARTDKAKQVGITLRNAFKKTLGPDALVVCYAQNLMIDWFYKGLYQGLSTKENPLELLTFNVEFMRHRPWLESHNIFINHGCVVLLSKILTSRHFGYVNNVRQSHQSVWLNRVSRLVEDYEPQSWVGVEQTPLNDQGKKRFMRHLAAVR
jgi:hypothetical protein